MRGKNRIYTKQGIQDAVDTSLSISDVCRKLGILRPKGGSYQLIQNRIKEYGIDTSHFLGKYIRSGKRGSAFENRKEKELVLVLVDSYMYRASSRILKRALLESGVAYECKICKIDIWNNMAITLDVDHINGDWSNCKIDNLRFLCPNCHRQTRTFGGKNKK